MSWFDQPLKESEWLGRTPFRLKTVKLVSCLRQKLTASEQRERITAQQLNDAMRIIQLVQTGSLLRTNTQTYFNEVMKARLQALVDYWYKHTDLSVSLQKVLEMTEGQYQAYTEGIEVLTKKYPSYLPPTKPHLESPSYK